MMLFEPTPMESGVPDHEDSSRSGSRRTASFRHGAVWFLMVLALTLTGCRQDKAVEEPPIAFAEAEAIWRSHCRSCHHVQALRAKDVAQIKRAMDQTPDMEGVRGVFEDRELAGILLWLERQHTAL